MSTSSFATARRSLLTSSTWSTHAQHPGNATRNLAEIGIADVAYQACQSAFVDIADLFGSSFGTNARRRDIDNQRKIDRFRRTGQWNDDDGIAPAVDFVSGKDDARASLRNLRATHRIERYPIHLTTLNIGAHLRGLVLDSLAASAACAIANSRSNVSRSKSESHSSTDPVKSALSHSCVSKSNSGCAASKAFMASHAATNSAFSLSNSCRTKSTKNLLRCRGGTARASLAATSSGRRTSTCLGGGVCVVNMI